MKIQRLIYRGLIFSALCLLVRGGYSQSEKKVNSKKGSVKKEVIIFPAPPDTARIQYLTSFSKATDISGKQSALQKTVLGEQQVLSIGKAYGIATEKGKIFICDALINGFEIVDLDQKKMTPFIPKGRGQLKMPINCFVDTSDGKLYVTDVVRKELVIFDADLNYFAAIGRPDTADNFKPMDVFVSQDKIWVTNPLSHQVYVYGKADRKLISRIPDAVEGDPDYLFNPINIYYRDKKIYITDIGDFRIKIFEESGKYLGSVGEFGKNIGQFVRPKGIAVDKSGILYVADAGFENVQIFNKDGKLLMFFGGPYNGKGDMYLPAKVHIDYENLAYYKKFISPEYEIDYLIFVVNQYGPDRVSVYGAIRQKEYGKFF